METLDILLFQTVYLRIPLNVALSSGVSDQLLYAIGRPVDLRSFEALKIISLHATDLFGFDVKARPFPARNRSPFKHGEIVSLDFVVSRVILFQVDESPERECLGIHSLVRSSIRKPYTQ